MAKGRRVANGRIRAYGYAIVTTAFFLVFTLAEGATQNFVTSHSRLAGNSIGIAIVLLLALAFRPLHQRVEAFVEGAFYKQRHEARAALLRLRKELASFNDPQQILRRVVEGVDHHMGAAGCALYLRHGSYVAEASSFDVAADEVQSGDALVVRLRSSSAPADPRALGSAALGDVAFPMMAGGNLVGFLTLAPKRFDFDAEDRHSLAALAEAAGFALLGLDPQLREAPKRATRPNNLPRQSTSFVGRGDEVSAVTSLVRSNPLVTLAGAGGMGKTRLALQVATQLLDETTEGAWFVDLAPIGDGSLVPSAILSALGADQSGDDEPLERLVKHLTPKTLLLVLDNSEHLTAEIARVAGTLVARCENVSVLATGREPLNVGGEVVHHVSSLDDASAAQLFAERARSVNERFELTDANRPTVVNICRHLAGIALAIELAAARVRSISLEELSSRLELRMLGRFGREPVARHQTMSALIEWSYDLLSETEKQLFVELAPFAGGFTLEAATATQCCNGLGELDRLDLITSLVDKSLLVAEVEDASQRYRFLEPIREYARERLERSGNAPAVLQRHAQTIAAMADGTYEEFDTAPKPDWLARNQREIDNVRAALRWTLGTGAAYAPAATLAGGFGPVFLRLTLLQEGVDWCTSVLEKGGDDLEPASEARVWYVLSMLKNNQGRYAEALAAAQSALEAYRQAGDERGIARALSQVAQQLENNGDPANAAAAGDRAVDAARRLGDRGVLASVLARSGNAFGPRAIETAQTRFAESARLYRELGREEERARVLCWWADAEYQAGDAPAAAALIEEAVPNANDDLRVTVTTLAAAIYWTLPDRDRAAPATRQALILADRAGDSIYLTEALSFVAMLAAETDPEQAARLFGYAAMQRERSDWPADATERTLFDGFENELRGRLGEDRFKALISEGTAWTGERAVEAGSVF